MPPQYKLAHVHAVTDVTGFGLLGHALRADPVNTDPYGEGWMALLCPDNTGWSDGLVSGPAIGPAYEDWMDEQGSEGCGKKGFLQ